MGDVQFADILFILLTCIVIFIILSLVHRGKKKSVQQEPPETLNDSPESSGKTLEED